MIFPNHQKQIQSRIAEYCTKVREAYRLFREAIEAYCKQPDRDALREQIEKVHQAEHTADNLREQLEVSMYSQAVYPEARGDILQLLEHMDKVPNHTESSIRMVLEQHITIPPRFCDPLKVLVSICHDAVEGMIEAVELLFNDYTAAAAAAGRVDQVESAADAAEGSLIEAIFASDIDGYEKLQMKDFVKHIARIADRAEDVGRHIEVMVAKRSL
jgi:uncharacterized protein